jgi:hypothetical protein
LFAVGLLFEFELGFVKADWFDCLNALKNDGDF